MYLTLCLTCLTLFSAWVVPWRSSIPLITLTGMSTTRHFKLSEFTSTAAEKLAKHLHLLSWGRKVWLGGFHRSSHRQECHTSLMVLLWISAVYLFSFFVLFLVLFFFFKLWNELWTNLSLWVSPIMKLWIKDGAFFCHILFHLIFLVVFFIFLLYEKFCCFDFFWEMGTMTFVP